MTGKLENILNKIDYELKKLAKEQKESLAKGELIEANRLWEALYSIDKEISHEYKKTGTTLPETRFRTHIK